jgi:hypothetical protein
MKYLIVEPAVKSIAPNIALMKWATWCENKGYEYKYIKGKQIVNFIPDKILMSCIFSFYSEIYKDTINYYRSLFPKAEIIVGGSFPTLNPKWFKDNFQSNVFLNIKEITVHSGLSDEIENLSPKYSVCSDSKKIVLYASRGCVNKCGYCAVPKLEGSMKSFKSIMPILEHGLKEIPDATGVVLYDNNFTAHEYFDNIVDELKDFDLPIDIHGLHVSDFTEHQAERFSELKWGAQHEKGTAYLRFSFDFLGYEKHIRRALKFVDKYNIKAGFFCYMLFNWKDSPQDFWKRIILAQEITDEVGRTIFLFPQRYEPLDSLKRNKFIGSKWTEDLVRGTTRLYTFMHGFLPVTTTHNIFRWIGETEEEFMKNVLNFTQIPHYRLIKK